MKSNSKFNNFWPLNRSLKIVLAAILLAVAIGAAVISNWPAAKTKNPTPAPTSSPSGQTKIDLSPANPSDNTDINNQKESPAPAPSPSPSLSTISVVLNQASVSDDHVAVRGTVYGATSGSCSATFSKGTENFSANGTVTDLGNYYSCGTIDVPTTSFPSNGTWTVALKLSSGGQVVNSSNTLSVDVIK